jgi:BirA family biotin operon repressor/biotin-[acetyl-CoA-carboxylase] ligase
MAKIDGESLHAALDEAVGARIDSVEIFPEIASTNSYLLNEAAPEAGRSRIAIADHQTAGRGQRGNAWLSPRLAGLYLSCAYTFRKMPQHFSCLTLAVGVAVADSLEQFSTSCKLKWPNDLMLDDGKLGGILTELQRGVDSTATVVVGLGLNLDFTAHRDSLPDDLPRIAQLRPTDGQVPDRAEVAASIIEHILAALQTFDDSGFSSFFERWNDRDWLRGHAVRVDMAESDTCGVASGIDRDGALLIRRNGSVERVVSGSVTLQQGNGETQ